MSDANDDCRKQFELYIAERWERHGRKAPELFARRPTTMSSYADGNIEAQFEIYRAGWCAGCRDTLKTITEITDAR